MASTEKLPSGKHRGVYYDSAGKKRHTPATTRKRDAYNAARDAETAAKRSAQAADGTLPGYTKYRDWLPLWLENRSVEPYTAEVDQWIIDSYVVPQWGDYDMAQISRAEVQGWINQLLQSGLSPGYVRRIYGPLRSSMSAAVDVVITGTPCVGIAIKGARSKASNDRVYEDEELEQVYARMSRRNQIVFEFIEETGLRPAELCGLHRHRIDRRSGWLTVSEVFDRALLAIKPYPKDEDARSVPLSTRGLELLDEWDLLVPTHSAQCGLVHRTGTCKSDLQFRQRNGNSYQPKTLNSAWTSAQKRAELENPGSPYDLRHTFGTRLAEAGVDPWAISRILGHATLEQSSTYIHRTVRERARVLAALGDPAVAGLQVVSGDVATQNSAIDPTSAPRRTG